MNAIVQSVNTRGAMTANLAARPVENEQTQFLTFMLGTEMFAVGILAVKEIIEFEDTTAVPMMPACIRGVINLRGAVVPVMDLSLRFGRAETVVTKRTCIVIVEIEANGEQTVIGMIVDAVNAVMEIPPSEIEPAPSFGTKVRADFIQGMGKVKGKFVLLINPQLVLSVDEISDLALAGLNQQQ